MIQQYGSAKLRATSPTNRKHPDSWSSPCSSPGAPDLLAPGNVCLAVVSCGGGGRDRAPTQLPLFHRSSQNAKYSLPDVYHMLWWCRWPSSQSAQPSFGLISLAQPLLHPNQPLPRYKPPGNSFDFCIYWRPTPRVMLCFSYHSALPFGVY